MIIEIRGVGFINKGAELMLLACLQRLRAAYPDALYTMAPSYKSPLQHFRKMTGLGFLPKAWLPYIGIQLGHMAALTPKVLRQMYGVVLDRDVDIVIDASGFAYSDQRGVHATRELSQSSKRWRKQGTKVVLLPQAFGPFRSRGIRRQIKRAVDNVDLIIAREDTSYNYLTGVTGEHHKIRQHPDFTNLIEGVIPDYFNNDQYSVCLIPNYRMIDMTEGDDSNAYLPFMIRCARNLLSIGERPFILIHEGANDRWLADCISEAAGRIPILTEEDPLNIKGIIGASKATIGSRFHGLVSALSQGVPSLATGWSHKYQELLFEYGFPEGLMPVDANEDELARKINMIVDRDSRKIISDGLLRTSKELKSRTNKMWEEVFSVLN